jgi:two-component system, cell cycle sensor histidine kinase and response regulator CckA
MNPAFAGIIGYRVPDGSGGASSLLTFVHPDERAKFSHQYERFVGSMETDLKMETTLLHKDGRRLDARVKICRSGGDGKKDDTLIFVEDITRHNQKIATLQQSEERFRFLIQNASDIIVVMDDRGAIIYESPSTRKILGYPSGFFVGRNLLPYIHADDATTVKEAFRELIVSKRVEMQIPFRFRKADGSWIDLEALANNPLESSAIRGIVVTCRDMTVRKKTAEKLEQSLAMTRSLINAMTHAALLLDNRGIILAANPTIARYLGRPVEELLHTKISASIPTGELQKWRDRWRLLREGGEPVRFNERIKGKDYDVLVHRLLDEEGRLLQIAIFGYDVTEHKLAEEALRLSRREWMTIFQAIGHPTVILDPEHRVVQANQAVCCVLGKTEQALIGRKCHELFHAPGSGHPPKDCPMRKTLQTEEMEISEMEMEALCGDFIVSCTPVLDDEGRLQKIIHIATDITERKQAEIKLEGERAFLRQVIDTVPGFISVKDAEGRFELVNKPLAKACGTTAERLIGRTIADFNPNAEEVLKMDRDNREVVRSRKEMFIPEEKVTYPDPSVQWLSVYKVPLVGRDGECRRILIASTDITHLKEAEEEKKKLQTQLIQFQKMEAIGTLAGGIAHDFNNILMGIQGYISLLLYDLNPEHPYRVKLSNIETYIKRGADLTRQLLGFAQGGKYDVMPTDMNDLLGKNAELFGRTRKEISISRHFAANLWSVDVDQGQMDQVFLNLFINASQAMPGGGNLDLQTDNVIFGEADVKLLSLKQGRYVKISVTDNGVGMDSKTLEKVFDPFFTTKPKGVGTGLGLASAYGIVKNHGGGIHVYSEPGKGATFHVYLPASDQRPSASAKREEEILTGRETILVVDDEKINITAMVEMLEMLHYRVLPVGSGQEAVAVYMEKGRQIDLIILDMIMPGISGGRTFDILREINPDLDVILASGYSAGGEARQILNRGCRGFIQKPFQLQELSQKVREVLDRKAGHLAA